MSKCKSTMCESDSLRNSEYCFRHYEESKAPPTTALALRSNTDWGAKTEELRGRVKRLRSDSDTNLQGIGMVALAAYAFGMGRRKSLESESLANPKTRTKADKDMDRISIYAPMLAAMAFSMMMKEKKKEGSDGA